MKPEKLNKFIAQMKIELAEAESKHPHFADDYPSVQQGT